MNALFLGLGTLALGTAILVVMAFGIVWLALSLRGVESSWWPSVGWGTEPWPDALPKLIGEFGPVGDLVGGILNPLVALCAFVALFFSLRIQQRSVSQQLDQENFFILLANRESAVSNLVLRLDGQVFSGRSAIREVIKYLSAEAVHYRPSRRLRGVSPILMHGVGGLRFGDELRRRVELFALLYRGTTFNDHDMAEADAILAFQARFDLESLEELLGHIFRSTYQVLKFAHACGSFPARKKVDLINYLRAQMSEPEFVVFGLSALTPVGKKSRAVSIAFDLFEDRLRGSYNWTRAMRYFFSPDRPVNREFARFHGYSIVSALRASNRLNAVSVLTWPLRQWRRWRP